MPKTTRAHGSGTRGSRRSRGSRRGLGITGPPRGAGERTLSRGSRAPGRCRRTGRPGAGGAAGWTPASGLVLQFALDRVGQLVPRVDELLDALVLEHAEDVVEVDPGVGDGLHRGGGLVVGLLDRGAGGAVVRVGLHGLL